MNKRKIGSAYEDQAADYLTASGYEILERNFRCKIGEIDLIAAVRTGSVRWIVFTEVKYRTTDMYGRPEEAVTAAKQKTIRRAAQFYLQKNHLPADTPCRFDVIAIMAGEIRHLKGVF
ncbi:MAG: YraN family protein [Lachnospiraceae bacterium]|nr:YraN family protein [Lachnospiraceae bacterium]